MESWIEWSFLFDLLCRVLPKHHDKPVPLLTLSAFTSLPQSLYWSILPDLTPSRNTATHPRLPANVIAWQWPLAFVGGRHSNPAWAAWCFRVSTSVTGATALGWCEFMDLNNILSLIVSERSCLPQHGGFLQVGWVLVHFYRAISTTAKLMMMSWRRRVAICRSCSLMQLRICGSYATILCLPRTKNVYVSPGFGSLGLRVNWFM